jgi:putative endonuclease
MKHFVYIIYSASLDLYYKGYSLDPEQRVIQHNNNESRYTCNKGPWILVYTRGFENKREALVEEKRIKRLNRDGIRRLIGELHV